MGLRDTIQTLEARRGAGQDVDRELACAYAEMCSRKNSRVLIRNWFDRFADLLDEMDAYGEVVDVSGVDPAQCGVWDMQDAVSRWLAAQDEEVAYVPASW